MSTSSRLLSLLSLLQAPRPWSGSELAARLEVSRRTVRRDIDRLRDLGYPVEGTLGVEGGYRLIAGTEVPPLLLDDDEAVAIVVGLRVAAANAVAGIDEASVRALAKLEQVLPVRLRTRFAGLGASTAAIAGAGPMVDPGVLTTLARAVIVHERVRFAYQAPDGTTTRRSVEPSGLVVAGRRWYLVAWDEDRAAWRTFRVDRVLDPWATGRPVAVRPLPGDLSPAEWLEQHRASLAPTFRLVATLEAPFEDLAGRAGDAVGGLRRDGDERCTLSLEGDTLPWLAFRLLSFDVPFRIHEPPELVAYVADLAGRLAAATVSGRSETAPGGRGAA